MVSNHPGPTEPPASRPSRFSDWRSILQLGTDKGLVSSLSKFGVFGLEVPSQETKRLVGSICYPGDMGFP